MYGLTAPMVKHKDFEIIDASDGFQFEPGSGDQIAWFIVRDSNKNIYCNFNFRVDLFNGFIPEVWEHDKPLEQATDIIKDMIDIDQLHKSENFKFSFHWSNFLRD